MLFIWWQVQFFIRHFCQFCKKCYTVDVLCIYLSFDTVSWAICWACIWPVKTAAEIFECFPLGDLEHCFGKLGQLKTNPNLPHKLSEKLEILFLLLEIQWQAGFWEHQPDVEWTGQSATAHHVSQVNCGLYLLVVSACFMSVDYRDVPDFGSGKSGIRLFFGNPAKSGSGQNFDRIWAAVPYGNIFSNTVKWFIWLV